MSVSREKWEEARALAIRRKWITTSEERIFVQPTVSRFSSSRLTSKAREADLRKIAKWSNEVLFDIWKMGKGDKDEVLKLVKKGHAVQMLIASETSQLTVP